MPSTEEAHRRALLHLADAVNNLASAVRRIKPDAVVPQKTVLGGDFQSDLEQTNLSIKKMLDVLRGEDVNG
jgi:hypothetical protein